MSISVTNVLSEVEEVALNFVAEHKRLAQDNDRLRQRVLKLEQDLEDLDKDFGVKCEEIDVLEKDRKKALARVDKMLKSLAALQGYQQERGR